MKKGLLLAVVFPAILLLTGCHDTSNSTATVKSAAYALSQDNWNAFYSTLGGDARATYGNKDAATRLKNRLAGKDLNLSAPRMISQNGACGPRCTYTVEQINVVSLSGTELTVQVTCNTVAAATPKAGLAPVVTCAITSVQ